MSESNFSAIVAGGWFSRTVVSVVCTAGFSRNDIYFAAGFMLTGTLAIQLMCD